jgi:membrane fusion protein (multidrug efflux system)
MHKEISGLGPRLGGALIILFASVGLVACGGQPPPQAPPPVEVGVLEVRPSALALMLEYAAQLRGVREVEVRSRVSGILLKRLYQEGAPVKEGAVLFQIDPAPFRAEVARANAELGVQQANLLQARRERDRILPLYEQKLISLRDRDNAIAAFETSEAAVEASRASLRRAQLDLSYTDVRAPISGLTSREVRSEGSLVTAGDDSSLLTHIVQADRLYVQFNVPESEATALRAALNGKDGSQVWVRVVDVNGTTIGEKAPIEFIAPSVGNETGTVEVRAVLDNKQSSLLPGQVARARIEGVNVQGSLVIPKRAVMHGAQGSFVWVVGEDQKAAPRPVKLGTGSGNNISVADGLVSGDRIVVDGVLKVQPGAPVKAQPVTLEGPKSNAAPAPAQASS